MDKKKALDKLHEVAKQLGETPLDFYEHLVAANEVYGISPRMSQAQKNGSVYDAKSDPIYPACRYYRDDAINSLENVQLILSLKKEDIVGPSSEKKPPLPLNRKLALELDNLCPQKKDYSSDERVHVLYVRPLYFSRFEEKFSSKAAFDSFIKRTKVVFRKALENGILNSNEKDVVLFVESNSKMLKQMNRQLGEPRSSIRVPHRSWKKLEAFRPSSKPDMKTSDIGRGLYFFVFEMMLNLNSETK